MGYSQYFEDVSSRFHQELGKAPIFNITLDTFGKPEKVEYIFKEFCGNGKYFGKFGERYIDGYISIYYGDETNLMATQDKRKLEFYTATGCPFEFETKVEHNVKKVIIYDIEDGVDITKILVYGRYDDFLKLKVSENSYLINEELNGLEYNDIWS